MYLFFNGGLYVIKKVQKNRNNYVLVECGVKILVVNLEVKVFKYEIFLCIQEISDFIKYRQWFVGNYVRLCFEKYFFV